MKYYDILERIKNQLELDENVKTVTEGDLYDVDLQKQSMFPISHIMLQNVTKEGAFLRFSITLLVMDIVDISKDETTDIFRGNDNEPDVLNTQLAVALRALEVFERGTDIAEMQLEGSPTLTPFRERFQNYLAGWEVTFDVVMPNTMTAC